MLNHIATGFDGSEIATAAARWAADEARRRNAALTVATCYTAPIMTDYGVADTVFGVHELDALRATTQRHLDRLIDELRTTRPGTAINGCAMHGRARQHLVEMSSHADMVVIGSSGTGESPLLMLGSLAHALIRKAVCPVVVVPGARAMPERPQVVATIDATAQWSAVVDWASDEADILGARLTIVHTWSYPYVDADEPSEARDLTRIDAATYLDRAVERAVARTGADVDGRLAEGDTSAQTVANAFAADLVVVGSPVRRTPQLVPTATLTDVVIAHATCPVAIIKPPLTP